MKSRFQLVNFVFFALLAGLAIPGIAAEKLVYFKQAYSEDRNAKAHPVIYMSDRDGKNSVVIGEGIYPDISVDGELLAFSKEVEGGLVIVTKNLRTGTSVQWTQTPAKDVISSNISGNRRYLGFSGPYGDEVTEIDNTGKETKRRPNRIAIIDMTKTAHQADSFTKVGDVEVFNGQPEILPSEGEAYFPEFSSDGRFVVFHQSLGRVEGQGRKAKNKQVILYDRLNKQATPITKADEYCFEPAYSYDDRYLAFICRVAENGADNDDIYTVDLLNFEAPRRRVTTDPGHDFGPNFRPDLSLVWSSDRGRRTYEFQLFEGELGKDGYSAKPLVTGEGEVHYMPSSTGTVSITQSVPLAHLTLARSSFGAARLGDQSVVVVAGHTGEPHSYVPDVDVTAKSERQTPADVSKWVEMAARPIIAQGFEAEAYGSTVFAFGGAVPGAGGKTGDLTSTDAIDVYDATKNSWQAAAYKLARPRSSYAKARLGNKVYLIGGWSLPGMDFIPQVEEFDMQTGKLRDMPYDLPMVRRGFYATTYKNKIIIVGGMNEQNQLLADVWMYDPSATSADQAWKQLASLPMGVFSPAAAVINDDLYTFGGVYMFGQSRSSSRYMSQIYRLSLSSADAKWQHTGRYMRESKAFFQVMPVVGKSEVTLIGGAASALPFNTLETFGVQ